MITSVKKLVIRKIIDNPTILEKLREEIDSVVGKTRLVQETDLPSLPYLQAIVKEGLRLHPPGPLFARAAKEGCKVGGFYVAENTPLVINAYAVMRDPDSWEDPNVFKPERFIFVGTAIGVMVQCFDWKIKGDKVNMEEARGALVLTMAHPLKCIPSARTPNLQIPSSSLGNFTKLKA